MIPKALEDRLKAAAKTHGAKSAARLAEGLLDAGLEAYPEAQGPPTRDAKLDAVTEAHGYASRDELVEHLLVRGLKKLEAPKAASADFEQRLRGLGYIE